MAASTVSTALVVFSGLFVLGVAGMLIWVVRLQKRQYPAKPLVTEPEERKRELRWYGFIYGGGRG